MSWLSLIRMPSTVPAPYLDFLAGFGAGTLVTTRRRPEAGGSTPSRLTPEGDCEIFPAPLGAFFGLCCVFVDSGAPAGAFLSDLLGVLGVADVLSDPFLDEGSSTEGRSTMPVIAGTAG